MRWPTDRAELKELQRRLAASRPEHLAVAGVPSIGGCFVCFARGGVGTGASGDPGWAASAVLQEGRVVQEAHASGPAGAPYSPGFLAAREGALLSLSLERLEQLPDVLLVNATGIDHPLRAGMALQIGWAHDVPTIGVTDRTLVAVGEPPGPWSGSRSPLTIDGNQVGWWLRTRPNARPVAITPGWGTNLSSCLEVVESSIALSRTPEPIRQARRLARTDRANDVSAPLESADPPSA